MHFSSSNAQKECQKPMSIDQFNQVVEAISEGRYSWACVLILRFAGYNPVHFIPYRTYSRLLKENNQKLNLARAEQEQISQSQRSRDLQPRRGHSIRDLGYLEGVDRQEKTLQGGNLILYFESRIEMPYLSLRSLNPIKE